MMLLLLYLFSPFYSEELPTFDDGFYFFMDNQECHSKTLKFQKEKFCITSEPILSENIIRSISPIEGQTSTAFFEASISQEIAEKLKKAVPKLKKHKLMVVINGHLVGMANLYGGNGYQKIRFYSANLNQEIAEVHRSLKQLLKDREEE